MSDGRAVMAVIMKVVAQSIAAGEKLTHEQMDARVDTALAVMDEKASVKISRQEWMHFED